MRNLDKFIVILYGAFLVVLVSLSLLFITSALWDNRNTGQTWKNGYAEGISTTFGKCDYMDLIGECGK